jgi:SAM-dependent methyltransferase
MSLGERAGADTAGVIWHEVECGAYSADLALWEELAGAGGGPVLELGCGSGRVACHLAARGHRVAGLDREQGLVAELERRAGAQGARGIVGDAREFDLDEEFALVLAPMQLVQLLDGPEERASCLAAVRRHLRPGGSAAFAIVESLPAPVDDPAPLPDVREVEGWVYSSLPLETVEEPDALVVRRLRQVVSPDGGIEDEVDEIRIRRLSAEGLEREGAATGLTAAGRRDLPPTPEHVGSTVVVLERRE